MTDYEKLKATLKAIGCPFASCDTLIGHTVSVYSKTAEIQYEFDYDGSFIRLI